MGEAGGNKKGCVAKISQSLSKLKTMAIRAKLSRSLGLVVYAAATEWWQLFTTARSQTPALLCTVVPAAHKASIEVQNASQQYSTQLAMTLRFLWKPKLIQTTYKLKSTRRTSRQTSLTPINLMTFWFCAVTCTQKKCCKESGLPCSSIVYHIQQDMRTKAWDQDKFPRPCRSQWFRQLRSNTGDWMVLKNLGSRFDKARRKGICCSKTKPSEPDFGNGLQGSTWNPEGYACVRSTLDAFCQWLPTIDCWSGSVICSQPEPCTNSFHLVQYHRSMNPMMAS